MLKNISLELIIPSKTNPRGKEFAGPGFDELVASIKEKGVLMPILVRPISPVGKAADYFEIVAGHRRFAAALEAGLKDIPAQVKDMTDTEAREAQIVENLQREDIHPLDEGEGYRKLIEKSFPKYDTKTVAIKVGKSESYVRSRLALTNLSEKAAAAFRKELITIGHAVLIARIEDEKIAAAALKEVVDYGHDVNDLKEYIQEQTYLSLSKKPWAKNAKLAEMVGDNSPKGPNLFDDPTAGVDPVAFAKQMAAFIEIQRREFQAKGIELIRISTEYGNSGVKGVLSRDQYSIVHKKDYGEYEKLEDAIIVQGEETGKLVKITREKKAMRGSELYKPTKRELAERKKQNAKEKAKREANSKAFIAAVNKVKMPLSGKQLDALLDFALYSRGTSVQQPVVTLLKLEPVMKEEEVYSWGSSDKKQKKKTHMVRDYDATLRKYAKENGPVGKMKIIFALMMPHPWFNSYSDGSAEFTKAAKKL